MFSDVPGILQNLGSLSQAVVKYLTRADTAYTKDTVLDYLHKLPKLESVLELIPDLLLAAGAWDSLSADNASDCTSGLSALDQRSRLVLAAALASENPSSGVLQHLNQAAGQLPGSLQHYLVLAIVSSSHLNEPHAELQQVLSRLAGKSVTLLPLLNSAGSESAAVDPAVMAVEVASATGLAGIMEDLGYACTQTESAFRDVLHQFCSSPDEAVLANVLGMMARTHSNLDNRHGTQASLASALGGLQIGEASPQRGWHVELVVEVLQSAVPDLNPEAVMEALDHDDFFVPDARGFLVIISAWRKLSPQPFPLQAVVGKLWRNTQGQLSFLCHAMVAPPDVFTFEHALRKLAPLDGLHGSKSAVGLPNHAWLCLDLYDTLSRLAEAGHRPAVHQCLEHPAKNCPEVLFVGMATVRTDWGILQHEVCEGLAITFVGAHPNSALVLQRVWPHNREIIMRAMLALYQQEDANIARVLEVCEELEALTVVLDGAPFDFAIELAALAAQRERLNLEKWLQERTSYHQLPFLTALIQFVARKLQGQQIANGHTPLGQAGRINLSLENLAIFLRVLQAHSLGSPPEIASEVNQLKHHALGTHPELQVLMVEAAAASSVPTPAASFPQDIEDEANAYFQKLYAADDSETVDTLIMRLKGMKASSSQRDQDVFRCMIQSLFDEYRFFHKYPEKELQTTAALFGGLINSNLIVDQSLGDALRLFLEAVRNPAGHKMCIFGLQALRKILDRLPAWPQYCRNLLQAAQLKEKDPELGEVAERIINEFSETRGAPPGFEQAAASASDPLAVQPDAATGVQLAEQALAEPSGAPTLAAVAAGTTPEPETSSQHAAQQMTAPGGQEVRLLPLTQQGKVSEADSDAMKSESSPFGAPSVQGTGANLPGSPRLPGGSAEDVQRPSTNATQTAMDHKRAFQAVNAETLEIASQNVDHLMPPHKVQDRIGFLINNLSNSNLEQKSKELKELLSEEYWPWFCDYMVVKRAAQEQNFHGLYASLLNALQLKELWRMLVTTTYKYVKVLLASERIKTQSSERSLLKNLGSWLGRITIAQGQPVKHKDLDIKGTIIDAYEQGKMIAVLPFVNKVLEPCKDSKVFRPPNPWITGILALMAEIYAQDKLKLNLTFEIEMLFRNFSLQISDTRVSKELVNRKRDMTSGTDFAVDKSQVEALGQASGLSSTSPGRGIPGVLEAPPTTPGSAIVEHQSGVSPARLSMDGPDAAQQATIQAKQHSQQGIAQAQPPQDQGLIGNYHNHVQINPSLQPIAERLGLKRMVPVAVDRAVADIITPVVERSVTIACMTTQELILKDFAMEADEGRMRKAAHLMVSSLAGSLALVTCREPLRSSLATQLRHLLTNTMEASQLEHTVQLITSDNFELGCTIIEKSATDKAVRDINERLVPAFQARQKAKAAGQPYIDATVWHGRFPQSLPEALRPKPGHLNPQQQRVYEDFARIPRAPAAAVAASAPMQGLGPGLGPGSPHKALASPKGSLASGDRSQYDDATLAFAHLSEAVTLWQQRLDILVAKSPNAAYVPSPEGGDVAVLVNEVLDIVPADQEEQNLMVARKIFYRLFEVVGNSLHTTACVAAIVLIQSRRLSPRFPADLTALWVGLADDRKWRKDAAEALLRARLLHAPELDAHLSKVLQTQRSTAQPVEFAVHLVRHCVVAEPVATAADFYNTLEVLQKLVVPQVPGPMAATLQQLIDQARRLTHVPAQKLNESGDPPELRAQVSQVFDEWIRVSDEDPNDHAHASFVGRLQQMGFLKGDDVTDRFLRIMTNLAVTHSLSNEATSPRSPQLSYLALDAYVRLICLLISVHGGGVPLLNKATSVLVTCLKRDAEMRSADFNGRPYYRIFHGFMQELSPSESKDVGVFGLLSTIANALLSVQPLQVPGFAFPWLELISHRNFMPKLVNDQQGWPSFQKVLIALLRFLEPYLRNAELTEAVRLLYKGTLRVLLVLLHDFPEFLCEYHFEVCNVVPPSCIQMRNLILSAFPRNMRLPDPFTPNLKVDLLPEIGNPPRFRPPAEHMLPAQMRAEVDAYLAQRQPIAFLGSLRNRLMLPSPDVALCGTRYNVALLNAMVFYVGIQAIKSQQQIQPGSSPVMNSPAMDVFQRMASDLDTEGRYLFLNALANQLRYPNNHTHYFSCVLLYLFAEAKQEIIQEQITRVLLERLIVNRPHPWGLLITFIELIKNPRYNFWSYSFTRCAGEIERLFESVARSCMGTGVKPDEEGQAVT